MHSFAYDNGTLCCEGVKLSDIAAAVGTPTFVYSRKTILDDLAELKTVADGIKKQPQRSRGKAR